MIVVSSDLHVRTCPLMSVVVIRMDLACEFLKIFRDDTPDPHSGRGNPLPHQRQLGLWPGAGRRHSVVGTQASVPLKFSAVGAPMTERVNTAKSPSVS